MKTAIGVLIGLAVGICICGAGFELWLHQQKDERLVKIRTQAKVAAEAVDTAYRHCGDSAYGFSLAFDASEREIRDFSRLAETDREKAYVDWLSSELPRVAALHNLQELGGFAGPGCAEQGADVRKDAAEKIVKF